MVFVKDKDLNLVYANKAFLELYEPELRSNVVGLPSAAYFLSNEVRVFHGEDQKALQTGSADIVEEITDYKGRVRVLHTRKTRYYDEAGEMLLLGVSMDVSELAARERALAAHNLKLENFAELAAHDLRSPLGAMRVSIEAIKADANSQFSERVMNYMKLMEGSLDGLMEQVISLLNMFKGKDTNQLRDELCEIALLLEEVRYNLSGLIKNSGAQILSEKLPKIGANKSLFRQLLHNLIENSLKHRRADVSPVVILRYDFDAGVHRFAVEDNGKGVPKELVDNLFDLGVRAPENGAGDSHGIGLSLCRDVVHLHGGRIWIDTAYDLGCRICFELPHVEWQEAGRAANA